MAVSVSAILPTYDATLPAMQGVSTLMVAIATGGMVYLITLSMLWLAFGKDGGAERLVLDKVQSRYSDVIRRFRKI